MTPRITVGIAGAGIGGLAAAALMARAGHEVALFDQFDAPRPVGSGVVIQPVGQAVLDRIGAGEKARALGARITRMLGREVTAGRTVLDVSYDRPDGPQHGLAMHRSSLFRVLIDGATAAGVPLTTSARIVEAPETAGGREIICEDGRRHGPFDLVIDATGVRSRLSPLRGRPLPYGALWSTVPWPAGASLPRDELSQRYRRADRMLGVLPIGCLPDDPAPLAAIFWSLPAAGLENWRQRPLGDWKAEATALWPAFAPFLDTIRQHGDMVPAQYTHGTLARPVLPALAFVGDAAHRASPQLGQGANMALLDALALCVALDRAEGNEALLLYARMRRWHVRIYQAMSWAFTPQYQSDSCTLPVLRDRVLMPVSRIPPVPRILTHLVGGHMIPPLAGVAFP